MAGVNNQGHPPHHGNQQQTGIPPEQNFYMAVTKHMDDVNKLLHFHGEMFGEMKGQVSSIQSQQQNLVFKFSQLEKRYEELRSYTRYLEDYCLELDVNSRKSHIILTGVPEDNTEGTTDNMSVQITHDKAVETLSSICDTITSSDLEATYRIGKPGRNPRPILIKFKHESVRNEVMAKKKLLKETDETKSMFMNEDLPPVINRKRAEMRAIVENAKNRNVPAKMMGNRMSVNNVAYEHKDIHTLPPGLRLADAKIQAVKGGIAFQTEHAYLSNFFPCPIKCNDIVFRSSEQLNQYERACFVKDFNSANEVLTAITPQNAKRATSRIQNSPDWDQVKLDKMKTIIDMKFNQNPVLKAEILKTGEVNLIEATVDSFWGAGLPLNSKKLREGHWRGHNHLGKLLMNYRYEVRRSTPPPHPNNNFTTSHYSNAPVLPNVQNQLTATALQNPTPTALDQTAHQSIVQPPSMSFGPRQNILGNMSFALPASQVYSTQYIPPSYQPTLQNTQSYQASTQQFQPSPSAHSVNSEAYSTYGERRFEYDPDMSPKLMS